MSLGAVEFANVSDPLSLAATLVKCIDEGGLGGGEISPTDINDATGGFLQGNARVLVDEGTVRYYPHGPLTFASAATADVDGTAAVAVGDTKGGYYITSVKAGKTNDAHSTLDVTARKHINGDYVDQAVT